LLKLIKIGATAAIAIFALAAPSLAAADGYCSKDFSTASACAINTESTTSYPGSSFANNETDYYVFYAQPGTELTASVLDEGNPNCGGGYCSGNQIELTDAYGHILTGGIYSENDNTDYSEPIGSGYSPQGPLTIKAILQNAGTYYLKVWGGLDGSDPSSVPYSLTVTASPNVQWPAPPPPPKPASAQLRLTHVTASRKHGVTIAGTMASNLVGRVYVYASCWNAKNHVIVSDISGRFSGHVSLPRLCIRRRAKSVFAGVVWGGSTNFTAAQTGRLFRITR